MLKSRILPVTSVLRSQYNHHQGLCTTKEVTDEEKEKEIERITKNVKSMIFITNYLIKASIDEPPTACCRSGCANCVFIVWAEALASKMENAGPEITEKIMNLVDDPSMKAYLEMELRLRVLKKK